MTHQVAAVVGFELGSERNTSGQEDEHVKQVHDDHDNGVACPVDVHRRGEQVEQREHGECCSEHGVVNDGRVACEGLVDHVTDEGHDEQGEDKLSRESVR